MWVGVPGEARVVDRVERLEARAVRVDPALGCFLRRFPGQALSTARGLDCGDCSGPLHGVAVGVKDIIATREASTTAQSAVHDTEWYSGADALAVSRLRTAGAVVMGKTSLAEHAIGRPDPDLGVPIPRNPWDVTRWTGGSSSGSASGPVAGLFDVGIGTDTNGSVRIPAALCGATGFKPTTGRIPLAGCLPLAPSLDTIGSLGDNVRDCLRVLAVMADGSPDSPFQTWLSESGGRWRDNLRGIRVATSPQVDALIEATPECRRVFDQALAALSVLGATVESLWLPELPALAGAQLVILGFEAFRTHHQRLRGHWHALGRPFRRTVAVGGLIDQATYQAAVRVRDRLTTTLRARLSKTDVVAGPTWPTTAPRLDDPVGLAYSNGWPGVANVTGLPAIALPMGRADDGLPLSLQLMAGPGLDSKLAVIADTYQRYTRWNEVVPAAEPWGIGPPTLSAVTMVSAVKSCPEGTSDARSRILISCLQDLGVPCDAADQADVTVTWRRFSDLVELVRRTAAEA